MIRAGGSQQTKMSNLSPTRCTRCNFAGTLTQIAKVEIFVPNIKPAKSGFWAEEKMDFELFACVAGQNVSITSNLPQNRGLLHFFYTFDFDPHSFGQSERNVIKGSVSWAICFEVWFYKWIEMNRNG